VPTEKRARQRAAREQKQAVIQKNRKRRRKTRRGIGLAIVAAAIVGIVFLVNSGSKSATPTTTTTTTRATTTTSTFPTPTTQPLTTTALAPTCPPATGSTKRVVLFSAAPPPCIPATSVWDATFKTSLGDIVVQMPAASSFLAVNNFVFLARYQYYNGTFFHRVIPGFVVQGGDPTGTGTGGATGEPGAMKYGYPGYQFTGNTPPAGCKTKPTLAGCYQPGDLALANSAGPSTDSSQFFFVLPGGQTTLNGEPNYTNFGYVTQGMNVVEKIGADGTSSGTPKVKVYLLSVTVRQVAS
jgi:cyclophilin family peptidyl-prolyl cis-trans isomerase